MSSDIPRNGTFLNHDHGSCLKFYTSVKIFVGNRWPPRILLGESYGKFLQHCCEKTAMAEHCKTVGGIIDTRYILLSEGGELLPLHHEPWKAEYHVPFSLKRSGVQKWLLIEIKTIRLPKVFLLHMSRVLASFRILTTFRNFNHL